MIQEIPAYLINDLDLDPKKLEVTTNKLLTEKSVLFSEMLSNLESRKSSLDVKSTSFVIEVLHDYFFELDDIPSKTESVIEDMINSVDTLSTEILIDIYIALGYPISFGILGCTILVSKILESNEYKKYGANPVNFLYVLATLAYSGKYISYSSLSDIPQEFNILMDNTTEPLDLLYIALSKSSDSMLSDYKRLLQDTVKYYNSITGYTDMNLLQILFSNGSFKVDKLRKYFKSHALQIQRAIDTYLLNFKSDYALYSLGIVFFNLLLIADTFNVKPFEALDYHCQSFQGNMQTFDSDSYNQFVNTIRQGE